MVILIGGVSCTGKTLMAQTLMEKYKMPYLSLDHLKMGLIRGGRYCDFTASDPDVEITEKLWPVVRGIIMTNIENAQNIIIEGCYISPDGILDFPPEYQKEILSLFLGFSPEYLRANFESGILAHRSEIEKKEINDYMTLDNFLRLHRDAKRKMEKMNYFEINEGYEHELRHIYRWIDAQVEKMKSLKKI